MEDIVSYWNTQLEKQVTKFRSQAVEIGQWERKLLENGNKIFKLYDEVDRVQSEQKTLDSNLEKINTQQQELDRTLTALDEKVTKLLATKLAQPPASKDAREKAHKQAEDLNAQLDNMSIKLNALVDKINRAQSRNGGTDSSPVNQIVEILNTHLHALQWVDQHTSVLHDKLKEAEKQFAQRKDEWDSARETRPMRGPYGY